MAHLKQIKYAYQLSLRQQRWVLEGAIATARRERHPASVSALTAANAIVGQAMAVENAYEEERGRQPDAQDAAMADREVLQLVTLVYRTIEARAAIGRTSSMGRGASDLLKVAFRKSLYGHVHSTYQERLVLTDQLVEALRRSEHRAIVQSMGLTDVVDAIETANHVFRDTITPEIGITKAMLADARQLGEEAFLRGIYQTAVLFDPADNAEVLMRDAILFPLQSMNAKLANRYKARARSEEGVTEEEDTGVQPEDMSAPAPAVSDDMAEDVPMPDGASNSAHNAEPIDESIDGLEDEPTFAAEETLAAK